MSTPQIDRMVQLSKENDRLTALIVDALPFVETYEQGDMLFQSMSRATYDDLVIRMKMAVHQR